MFKDLYLFCFARNIRKEFADLRRQSPRLFATALYNVYLLINNCWDIAFHLSIEPNLAYACGRGFITLLLCGIASQMTDFFGMIERANLETVRQLDNKYHK